MPYFGICYAVVWYVLCRAGICYAVLAGMRCAVVLWITFVARLLASHSAGPK
jgi:hypothetical protein